MKFRNAILTAGMGIALAVFGGMAQAGPTPQKEPAPAAKQTLPKSSAKAATSVSLGTITSIDNERLVMSHKTNGKTEDLTFMLNSQTERKGDLKPGAAVSVHYKKENNQLMATAIQAMPPKTESNAKKPVVTK